MVADFLEVKRLVGEVALARFDHAYLNDDPAFSDGVVPSTENLVQVLWGPARRETRSGAPGPAAPVGGPFPVRRVRGRVIPMATMSLTKVLSFSASHRLTNPALSETPNRALYGPCHRCHGHDDSLEVTVRRQERHGCRLLEDTIRTAVLDLVAHHDLGRDVPAL
jgi:6-pyruvoyl-tetrahydropterin synthase